MVRLELNARTETPKVLALAGACLVAVVALALLQPQPGSAASLVGKDGKIHACYKAKGKGKGNLRVVHGAKAKCPKGWRKAAWVASPASSSAAVGSVGPRGEQGPAGQDGPQGATGAAGRSESVVVDELESKVTELLTKVQGLEAVLAGVDNAKLKEAIESVAKVEALEGILAGLSNLELKEAVAGIAKVGALEAVLAGINNAELKEAIESVAKVSALETLLAGVTHAQLLEAVGLAPAVEAVCEESEKLTGQTTALGSTLTSLNSLLNTILLGFSPVSVPTALPSFACPSS